MTRNMKYILIERHWFVSKVVSGCLLCVCRLIDFRCEDATQLFCEIPRYLCYVSLLYYQRVSLY